MKNDKLTFWLGVGLVVCFCMVFKFSTNDEVKRLRHDVDTLKLEHKRLQKIYEDTIK